MISGIVCETRGNTVGRQDVERVQLLLVSRGVAAAPASAGSSPLLAARAMILSSTSVKFMTWRTSYPLYSR